MFPLFLLSSPHLTSPHLTSPHLTSPHLTSPHLTSPHLTSPHLTSPHFTSFMVQIFIPFTKGNLTTETKPDVVFHVSRVPRVDFSCALRVFSRGTPVFLPVQKVQSFSEFYKEKRSYQMFKNSHFYPNC